MNQKYHVFGKDIILSQSEHEKVVEMAKQGKADIWLRNNTVHIPIQMAVVTPTDEATEVQFEQSVGLLPVPDRPKLPTADIRNPGFRPLSHADFYKKMGWEDKPVEQTNEKES